MRLVPGGITSRLFLAFFATAVPLLLAAGLLLERQARGALEEELGRRVESLAVAVAASIPQESWQMLFSLGPGEEESRTARHLRSLLQAVGDGTGSERVTVWSLDGRVVLDAATPLLIGSPAPRAALLRDELNSVRAGRPASTPLFRAEAGHWVKIGLAPITAGQPRSAPRGVLVIQAPSGTLAVVARMRATLLAVGLIALAVVVAAAFWVSRAATRRIRGLVAAAQRIGRGDLDFPVAAQGDDEIGVLADALESMRAGVQVRDRQLRAMVGGVAHEIRNPLGGLLLFAEMLAGDSGLAEEPRARAHRIVDETSRLERVVAEFLAFARPESPRGARVPLAPVLRESAEIAVGALRWSGRWEVVGDSDAEVWCDPDHLRQITLNLIQNGMQATGDDGGRVRLRIAVVAEGVTLVIEDSGPGIAAAGREEIFEPFFTTRSAGAGLGLAIVKRLCDLNRVTVAVGSSELGGAAFALGFRRVAESGRAPQSEV